MLKLTKRQISDAGRLAYRITSLEAAKDKCIPFTVPYPLEEEGWYGRGEVKITVPVDAVRKEIAARLEKAHIELAALGIEFMPSDEEVSNG